jgi:hypothetical protein
MDVARVPFQCLACFVARADLERKMTATSDETSQPVMSTVKQPAELLPSPPCEKKPGTSVKPRPPADKMETVEIPEELREKLKTVKPNLNLVVVGHLWVICCMPWAK